MGNAVHWAIFLSLAISSIALISYSLVGKTRSVLIAIPVAGLFCFSVYIVVMTQQIPGPPVLTVFLLVGSGLGLVRQFPRKIAQDNNVNKRDR